MLACPLSRSWPWPGLTAFGSPLHWFFIEEPGLLTEGPCGNIESCLWSACLIRRPLGGPLSARSQDLLSNVAAKIAVFGRIRGLLARGEADPDEWLFRGGGPVPAPGRGERARGPKPGAAHQGTHGVTTYSVVEDAIPLVGAASSIVFPTDPGPGRGFRRSSGLLWPGVFPNGPEQSTLGVSSGFPGEGAPREELY